MRNFRKIILTIIIVSLISLQFGNKVEAVSWSGNTLSDLDIKVNSRLSYEFDSLNTAASLVEGYVSNGTFGSLTRGSGSNIGIISHDSDNYDLNDFNFGKGTVEAWKNLFHMPNTEYYNQLRDSLGLDDNQSVSAGHIFMNTIAKLQAYNKNNIRTIDVVESFCMDNEYAKGNEEDLTPFFKLADNFSYSSDSIVSANSPSNNTLNAENIYYFVFLDDGSYNGSGLGSLTENTDIISIGCDFNKDDFKFYYYYLELDSDGNDEDGLIMYQFSSSRYIHLSTGILEAHRTDNYYAKVWAETSEEYIASRLISVLNEAMQNFSDGDNTNLFSTVLDGTSSNDAKYIELYNIINNIIGFKTDTTTSGEAYIKSNYYFAGNNAGTRYNIWTGLHIYSSEANVTSNMTRIDVNDKSGAWSAFGNKMGLLGESGFEEIDTSDVPSTDTVDGLVADITGEVLATCARYLQSEGVGESKLYTASNLVGPTGSYLNSIFNMYAAQLQITMEMSTLDKLFDGQDSEIEVDDIYNNYELMWSLLDRNVTAIANNEEFNQHISIKGSDVRIEAHLSNHYQGSDTVKNSSEYLTVREDIWDELTQAQRDYLGTLYYLKLKSIGKEDSESKFKFIGKAIPGLFDVEPIFTEDDYTKAKEAVKKYSESDLVFNKSALNIARCSSIAMKYVMSGIMYNVEDYSKEYFELYNANLEAMVDSPFLYVEGQQDWFPKMPSYIGRINLKANSNKNNSNLTENAYRSLLESSTSWNRFLSVLYNVEYAFEIMGNSALGEDKNFKVEDLKNFFSGESSEIGDFNSLMPWLASVSNKSAFDASQVQLTNDQFSIDLLRSIIELHDLCEFLQIEKGDWTPTIDAYLEIYKSNETFFNSLRNNNYIYKNANKGESTVEEPLGKFFSIQSKKVSDQWVKGFALSALYVPMETNLYDATSITFLNDPEWISDFFYKYAFYRKALYINTDNSAIVNDFVSGQKSGTRVATLNDLLNYDRDIALYVDDNFYNADEINSVIDRLDYANLRANSSSTTETDPWSMLGNAFGEVMDLSTEQVLKTGNNVYYSTTLAENVTKFGNKPTLVSGIVDVYVLPEEDLLGNKSVLDEYEYSVKQSYGVVSAVYRDAELYNELLNSIVSDNAIFKSSKAILHTPGSTSSDWRCIYNYMMLANLESQMRNDAASALDLDSPIFCDLFGNIVTESGLVIIPAACNATLCGSNWNPYTIGWSEYYNNGNRIPVGVFEDEVYTWLIGRDYSSLSADMEQNYLGDGNTNSKVNAGGFFEVDASGVLTLRTTSLTSNNLSAIVQWDFLNKNSNVIKQLFFNDAYYTKGINSYSSRLVNLIVETLRGAPIEFIDYLDEGLDGNVSISKYGIYSAYKLEELNESLISGTNGNSLGGNAVVTMPNLAFVDGIEVYMLYVFKVAFAVMVVGLVLTLYLDAVKNHLGFKSVGKFVMTCFMVILAFTVVPNMISWSYYKSNKDMLTDEISYVMMLNYVKEYDGSEIGITKVSTPETNTELYLKVGTMELRWWNIIYDVLFTNTAKSVTDLYERQLEDNAMAKQKNVVMKSDGLYINVQDIYNSTSVIYQPTDGRLLNKAASYTPTKEYQDLYQNVSEVKPVNDVDTVSSFTSPYYVFLDQLVANINEYNETRGVSATSWSVGGNGNILTYDVVKPYFMSSEFLEEGFDILGLQKIILGLDQGINYNFIFNESDIRKMRTSYWFPDAYSEDEVRNKVNNLYDYARDYIANNSEVLGKVPDEVFLKVLSMQLAVKFNQMFNVNISNSIEIMNIDTRDLMRFMIGDRGSIYKYYSYSYSRYVYEESGVIGVVFSALLIALFWLTSFLKPLFMIVILGLLVINVIGRKMLFRKESRCIEGYLIGCACLCLCNYAYSFMLKVSLSICDLGLGSVTAMVFAFIVQVLYILGLVVIIGIEVKDWRNSGFHEFANIGGDIISNISQARNMIVDKLLSKTNEAYGDSARSRRYVGDDYSLDSVDQMLERDAEREENGTYSIS